MRNFKDQVIKAFIKRKTFIGNRAAVISQDGTTLLAYYNSVLAISSSKDSAWISLGRFNTISTKSLLNAIPGVKIRTINKQLQLNGKPWDGELTYIKLKKDVV